MCARAYIDTLIIIDTKLICTRYQTFLLALIFILTKSRDAFGTIMVNIIHIQFVKTLTLRWDLDGVTACAVTDLWTNRLNDCFKSEKLNSFQFKRSNYNLTILPYQQPAAIDQTQLL